jgi:phospholipid/cholesterol/gamma-HCH transport system permease protein
MADAEIDGRGIDELDSTGGWLLVRTKVVLQDAGLRIASFNVPEGYAPLLSVIESEHMVAPTKIVVHDTVTAYLERIGRATHTVVIQTAGILGYVGRVTVEWFKTLYAPRRHFRITATVHQIEEVGINALPIVGLLMLLVGVVLAYQGADQLKRFDLEIFTVNALGVGVLRELGVLITAIIIAGRSGSAFTAQIGTMKVNEEIDAMQTMGLNVDDVLILPRVVALVIALPILTFYADIMALIGGALMCYFQLDITAPMFIRQLHQAVTIDTFLVGMIKAPVFAYVIGMVGCYEGLNVERNAASVGKLTTRSVVESVFLVIVLDAGFSIIFSTLGI